jgi:phenylacetate-CoA ligase
VHVRRTLAAVTGLAAPYGSGPRLRRYQSARLRALVRHCWQEVPIYRRALERAHVDPSRFRGLEDLHTLPIMTRLELQRADQVETTARSLGPAATVIHRTSGSSGTPLTIRRTTFEEWLVRAFRLQTRLRQGLRPWHRQFHVGTPRPRNFAQGRLWNRLGLLRKETEDSNTPIADVIRRMIAVRPDVVSGYSGTMAAIADALTDEDRRIVRPRHVVCGAETVPPAVRRRIEQGFRAPLFVGYGAHECGEIASDCGRVECMHVCGGSVLVELLRDGQPVAEGEVGEVVITSLHSCAMPFLRYRLADLARRGPEPCPCGAPFSTLLEVQGRTAEMFHLPDGRQLHPYVLLVALVDDSPWLRQYQLVQERPDLIRVRVAGLDAATAEQREQLRLRLVEACGGGVRIDLESVDEIRPEPNGKFKPYYRLFDHA